MSSMPTDIQRLPSPGRDLWRMDGLLGADTLTSLAGINELALELLARRVLDSAHATSGVGSAGVAANGVAAETLPPMLLALRTAWSATSSVPAQRLAQCPYLLVDMRFSDAARWRAALGSADVPRDNAPALTRRPPARSEERDPPESATAWFGPKAPRLAWLALVFAWHLARSQRLSARIALGMSDDTARAIAGLSVHELERSLEVVSGWLQPRWSARVGVWRHLLEASSGDDDTRLRRAQLRGLQLLAAEIRDGDARTVPPRSRAVL